MIQFENSIFLIEKPGLTVFLKLLVYKIKYRFNTHLDIKGLKISPQTSYLQYLITFQNRMKK